MFFVWGHCLQNSGPSSCKLGDSFVPSTSLYQFYHVHNGIHAQYGASVRVSSNSAIAIARGPTANPLFSLPRGRNAPATRGAAKARLADPSGFHGASALSPGPSLTSPRQSWLVMASRGMAAGVFGNMVTSSGWWFQR